MTALPSDRHLARIRWRCRRGMRELDTLLMRYAEHEFVNAAAHHRIAFEELLNLQDPEILDLLTGRVVPDDQSTRDVLQRLLTHT